MLSPATFDTVMAPDKTMSAPQQGQANPGSWVVLRRGLWCAVTLGLLLRLGAFAASEGPVPLAYPPDSGEYDRLGLNLAEHEVFSLAEAPPWSPDVTRTPVFPLFVAA